MELGFKGTEIGEVLKHLLQKVIIYPEMNHRDRLIKEAIRYGNSRNKSPKI